MTSHSPSVHQLPREKDFRRLFVPGKGNVFLCDDYGQMQLRIAAELSGDARLLRAYELGEDVHRLNLDHRLLTAWCPKELRGLPVVVGDDSPELALASDLTDRLRLEVGVEYVVADLSPLMRPLRVVVIEPERHDAVELAWREEEVVRAAGPTGPHPSRASSRLGSPVRLRSAALASVEVGHGTCRHAMPITLRPLPGGPPPLPGLPPRRFAPKVPRPHSPIAVLFPAESSADLARITPFLLHKPP
jgi:hypothetical protein